MEFPIGVFGIALATVVLPSLSKEHASGTQGGFSAMLDWALRWVVMIAVPATFALYLLAVPLLSTIFQYNAFTDVDVMQSALALEAFSIGIFGFIVVKVLAPGFFARQDTKTPMQVAVIAMLANLLASLILVRTMQHTGLALAISIAAWINAGLLFFTLVKRRIYVPESGWLWFILRIALSVTAMCGVLTYFNQADSLWLEQGLWQRIRHLAVLVVAGGSVYVFSLFVLGLRPQQLLLKPREQYKQG
jgi:putative peptidoglycan lipid II flippase